MKSKICYVVTVPLTIRSFFIPQLQYLAEHGFDVTVVCRDDGSIEKELGCKIHFHGIDIPRGVSFGDSIQACRQLKRFFREQGFDLIQYSTPNAALYASIAAKAAGCRSRNYHLMGYRFLGAKGFGRLALKEIEKLTCKLSTSIECVSQSNLELGVEEGLFKEKKATVVWNGSSGGVDLKRFDIHKRELWRTELRQKLGYHKDDFVYGFVGRITKDKGLNELLEAFFSLHDDSKLFIIGPNENDRTVDAALWEKASRSERIVIHPPSNEIEKYYAMMDVLVLPSYREGFGNVVIEAAAMGSPAIVCNIPGQIDTIENTVTALSVEPKNAVDLAKKMKQIRCMDYVTMGENARSFVSNSFSSTELLKKTLKRKQDLLGKAFMS